MKIAGKLVEKHNLPKKLCRTCRRQFAWRKKWKNCWDSVLYCSERCRRNKTFALSYESKI